MFHNSAPMQFSFIPVSPCGSISVVWKDSLDALPLGNDPDFMEECDDDTFVGLVHANEAGQQPFPEPLPAPTSGSNPGDPNTFDTLPHDSEDFGTQVAEAFAAAEAKRGPDSAPRRPLSTAEVDSRIAYLQCHICNLKVFLFLLAKIYRTKIYFLIALPGSFFGCCLRRRLAGLPSVPPFQVPCSKF